MTLDEMKEDAKRAAAAELGLSLVRFRAKDELAGCLESISSGRVFSDNKVVV